jgi:RHS repeat-associated protein
MMRIDLIYDRASQIVAHVPRFTGKERDTESGLDYFGARFYASSMRRWMSPDWADKPEAAPYSKLDNPQTLNLYGYVNFECGATVGFGQDHVGSSSGE